MGAPWLSRSVASGSARQISRTRSSGVFFGTARHYGFGVARDSDAIELEIAGHAVRITSPGKVLFSERGETKLDLVNYYLAVAEPVMRAMGGRPVLMERYPHGAEGSSFYQKRVPDNAPDWLTTTIVSTPNGTKFARARDRRSRARRVGGEPRLPRLPRVAGARRRPRPRRRAAHRPRSRRPAPISKTRVPVAHLVRALLDELGIVGYPKTTGKHGIHVYLRLAPRWDPYQVRFAAVAFARELARRHPDVVTDAWWKEERGATHLRRLQPERAAQDGVRRVVCTRPAGRAGVDAVQLGRARHHRSRRADDRDRARRASPSAAIRGQTMSTEPQSLEPLLALHERDRANGLQDAPWPPVYPKMPGEPPRVAPSRARKEPKAK